jgi:hypothetical protein
MPEKTTWLPLTGTYSLEEYEGLQRGIVPRDMDDKWFIVEDAGTLSFYRSWTGICVYQIRLEARADRYEIVDARVNGTVGGIDIWYEARLLRWLIQTLLLGQDLPFPKARPVTEPDR